MNTRIKITKFDKKSLSEKSKNWLRKHMNDPFVRQSQKDGYICRAAYKLIEIQEKFKLFSKAHNVVELGSSPGGWSQVLSQILHSGKIFAIDLLPMKFVHHKIFFIQGDFVIDSAKILEKIDFCGASMKNDKDAKWENNQLQLSELQFSAEEIAFQNRALTLKEILLNGNQALKNDLLKKENNPSNFQKHDFQKIQINGVISDMAPNSSGDNQVDHWRIMDLAYMASEFAKKNLSKGGYFVTKIFFGGSEKEFVNSLKKNFKEISFFKPDSSRKDSSEIYIVAKNFIN